MAITSSAKKANRASRKKKEYNDARKANIRKAVKAVQKYVREKNAGKAAEGLRAAYVALDKAAKQNTIKWGTADRKKARLAKLVSSIA